MKLLFVHGEEKLKEDKDNNFYTDGSYSMEVWDRYLSLFNKLSVVFRKEIKRYEPDYAKRKFQFFNKDTINFIEIPDLNSSIFSFLNIKRRRIIHRIIEKSILEHDCLIARLPSSAGNLAVKYAKKHRKPYLVEVVGCPMDTLWNHSIKGKLLAPFVYYRMKLTVKDSPYVIYVTKEFLQGRYPSVGKVIGCSDVNLDNFNEETLIKRLDKINNINEKIIIGTIGAVNVHYKGQKFVIEAISQLNKQGYKFEYQIVGAGDTKYLRSLVDKLGITDNIKFLGSLPHNQVLQWLDTIDIYIHPSLTEGLPRSLIEAMSRGCPSFGSNVGGIPELLLSNDVFEKGSSKDICRVLASIKKKDLLEKAIRNYKKSKEFNKTVLENKRRNFLKEFYNNVK